MLCGFVSIGEMHFDMLPQMFYKSFIMYSESLPSLLMLRTKFIIYYKLVPCGRLRNHRELGEKIPVRITRRSPARLLCRALAGALRQITFILLLNACSLLNSLIESGSLSLRELEDHMTLVA